MKIAVGISSGVDSSVTALLLKEKGHEITGVTMNLWKATTGTATKKNSCFNYNMSERKERIRMICGIIGIEHLEFDLSNEFSNIVLSNFKKEYLSGRTPNPCVICNSRIKFGLLSEKARKKTGSDFFATGHYARIEPAKSNGRHILRRAKDLSKDQSYFLYGLTQCQLKHTLFPLGEFFKDEVREIARKKGLPSWSEPESQDFYFGDYSDIIDTPVKSGEITDTEGRILGHHEGIWKFTIGQRHGLKIAHTEPLYVIAIDYKNNKLIAGSKNKLLKKQFSVRSFNWVSMDPVGKIENVWVKIRAAHRGSPCSVFFEDENILKITLANPEEGIAPGQSAVVYDGEKVVGGGIIYCF
ncbi:tRNA 2-thiouridine(34) synthase MnmA [candidate division WOR-3 bacterium]|nr:tRNA 2-thiouridine(34) synthase MnmA [candidate division WOR-3 bacterium]